MRVRKVSRLRRGATSVETAIVIPVVLMFTLGMSIMGLGVFRYQQTATLAREGARYASVHGSQYATDTGNAAATSAGIYTNAIQPLAAGLNASKLTYSVQWGTDTSGSWQWTSWDSSGKAPTSPNPNSTPANQPMYNAVKVTVTYQWTPELYVTGPISLTSTSVMPTSY
jgi:Flp pilus assembly protein TadG